MNPGILARGLSLGQDPHTLSREVVQVRLIVTRPNKGVVDLLVDDRRGLTGKRWATKGVKVAAVRETVGAMLTVYEERRKSIQDARQPKQ